MVRSIEPTPVLLVNIGGPLLEEVGHRGDKAIPWQALHALEAFDRNGGIVIGVTGRSEQYITGKQADIRPIRGLQVFRALVVENGGAVYWRRSPRGGGAPSKPWPWSPGARGLLVPTASGPMFLERLASPMSPRDIDYFSQFQGFSAGVIIGAARVDPDPPATVELRAAELQALIADRLRQDGRDRDWELRASRENVMIVPTGISKLAGSRLVLDRLGVDIKDVVAIADTPQDYADLLRHCGVAATVKGSSLATMPDRTGRVIVVEGGPGIAVVNLIRQMYPRMLAVPRAL